MENIEFASLIPFVLVTIFTPGPGNITCTSIAVNFGIKRTINYIYGLSLGFFCVNLMAGFFLNLLLKMIPHLESIMRWIGAIYILYLAYNIYKADYSFQQRNQQVKPKNQKLI